MAGRQATSTIKRRRIGSLLRKFREEHDPFVLSKDAAAHIKIDATRLGRIEKGRYKITPDQISGLLDFYGISDQVTHDELRRAALEDPTSHWWYAYRKSLTQGYTDFIASEDEAIKIRAFAPGSMPGLLQCAAYAKETQETTLIQSAQDKVETLFAVRMARNQVISRPARSTMLEVVIPESIFAFETTAMVEQIHHLQAANEQPNVKISILPNSAPLGARTSSSFTLMDFIHPWPTTVHIDSPHGGKLDEEGEAVDSMEQMFSGVKGHALPADKTREFLEDQLRKIER